MSWTRLALVVMCVLAITNARLGTTSAADFNTAGLVVDYGDGRISYAWVPFEEDEISGIDLLERSGLDLVTVGFGGMGDAVCQIDDTGCPVGECRKRLCQTSDPESSFWRYSNQTAPGEWTFVATGASGSRVHSGEIYAWSWTGTDVALPAISMDELVERAGAEPMAVETSGNIPAAAFRTEGGVVQDAESDPESFVAEIAGTVVVLGIAGFAIWRSRRAVRAAP